MQASYVWVPSGTSVPQPRTRRAVHATACYHKSQIASNATERTMSQYSDPRQGPPSIGASNTGQPYGRPQVVQVVAKPGGFWRAMSIIAGLFLFGAVFIVGIVMGIAVMVAGANYDTVIVPEPYRNGDDRYTVAVIPVEGVIDERQAEFVRAAVDYALDDSSIRAVVLRVDSPGGGVTPSDQIWYEINRLKKQGMPVVASYGGVAASGGYYVSCGADYIIAQETCITGSIGVIAQVLTLEGLMNKVGVQPVTLVASGSPEKSVANDIFRSWTEQDKAKVQVMLDSAHRTFINRVSDGRKNVISDPMQISAIANGSIYTAQQAIENGLIDAIGYLDDAVTTAESRAKIGAGSAMVVILRQPPTLGDALFAAQGRSRTIQAAGALDANAVRALVNDLSSPRAMYLMH